MVNRYDSPAQAEFINTYVPIPFEQLYKLGKEAKEDVEQAMKDYTSTLDKWGEFISPSQLDMQTYYNETIGRFAPIANEMAANPEAWKDASFRAKMYSTINNTDRAKLSGLRQSADFMRKRQEINAKLMMENKFNKDWHAIDFTNYDTTKQGVFQDISPVAYQSVNDLVHPYVNDLKPSSLGSHGGMMWQGITKERTRAQVDANITEIMNTPAGRKHIETMMRNGMSQEEAMQTFMGQAYRAAEEKAWELPSGADPYAMLAAKARFAGAGSTSGQTFSRVGEIQGALGLKKAKVLGLDPSNTSPEEVESGYSEAYEKAYKGGNKDALELLRSVKTNIGNMEAHQFITPGIMEKQLGTVAVGNAGKQTSQVLNRDRLFNSVVYGKSGMPAAEVAAEYIMNNEHDVLKNISHFWTGEAKDKQRLVDLTNSYGDIIQDFVNSIDPIFVPSNQVGEYDRILGDPYGDGKTMISDGYAYITEDQLEAAIAANKGRYGTLEEGDIESILVDGIGSGNKHAVLEKVSNVKLDDADEGQTMYRMKLGIPSSGTVLSGFDRGYGKEHYGTSNNFKQNNEYLGTAYHNSNL